MTKLSVCLHLISTEVISGTMDVGLSQREGVHIL